MTNPQVQTVHITEAVSYEIHGPDDAVLFVEVQEGMLIWRDITVEKRIEDNDITTDE